MSLETFTQQMTILSQFLCGDYYIEDEGYIESSDTDNMVWNVMEYEGGDNIKYDEVEEVYYMGGGRLKTPCDLPLIEENDIVCGDYTENYYSDEEEVSQSYTNCDDNTVIWIHPVKSGSVVLDLEDYTISGGENSSYDTPSTFVIIDNKSYPLETR